MNKMDSFKVYLKIWIQKPRANLVQTRIFPGPPDWAAGEPLAEAWLLLEHFLEQHLLQELYKNNNTRSHHLFLLFFWFYMVKMSMYALNNSIFNKPPRCRVIVVPGDSLRGSSFSTGGGGRSTGAALNGVGIAPILASLLGGSSLPTEENDLLPLHWLL